MGYEDTPLSQRHHRAQWALIESHIPPVPQGGRPRETDPRDVVDAIFYIPRTGCQWRYLPRRLPTQEHRLAGLRPVAVRRHPGRDP